MELSLKTDGSIASVRVHGRVSMAETTALCDYLRVARENGAVRCIVDLTDCTDLPTTIVPVLTRESLKFQDAGGLLALSGVGEQNPFLAQAVAAQKFVHYRSLEEAWGLERLRALSPEEPSRDGA